MSFELKSRRCGARKRAGKTLFRTAINGLNSAGKVVEEKRYGVGSFVAENWFEFRYVRDESTVHSKQNHADYFEKTNRVRTVHSFPK